MVKNITIKDEAYEYLKNKKGNKSFSDLILEDADSKQKTIHISKEAYNHLNTLKTEQQSFSEVILALKKEKMTLKEILNSRTKFISDARAKEMHKDLKKFKKEMEEELDDRARHLFPDRCN